MKTPKKTFLALAGILALGAGCETKSEQGAVIGGLGGALVGSAVTHHHLLGALIGGAAGAGGGYLIGSELDKADRRHRDDAIRASEQARLSPVSPEQARLAPTADVNGDGYVTMDEVVAMQRAGLSDDTMIDKLRATGQFFELSPQQEDYLRRNGVDNRVIMTMRDINRSVRDQAYQRYQYEPQ